MKTTMSTSNIRTAFVSERNTQIEINRNIEKPFAMKTKKLSSAPKHRKMKISIPFFIPLYAIIG